MTDSEGRFVLRPVPSGEHLIRVRRIGFQPQYLRAVFQPGEEREVTIALAPGAYLLPDVDVTAVPAKPLEYAYTTKYDEFFRRQRIGLGRYVTRRDIDRKMASETPSLLMGLPGVQVIPGAPGVKSGSVRLRSCEKTGVWVDGIELKPLPEFRNKRGIDPGRIGEGSSRQMVGDPATPGEFTAEMLERIHPLQIEMIEVYIGPAQMPAETVGNSCAAIMIWTR